MTEDKKDAAPVQLMDVTLRDGSYAVNYSFTPERCGLIVSALHRAGIPFIEIGHGCGLGAHDNLRIKAAARDKEYVKAAREAAPEACIGVIAGPPPVTLPQNIDEVIDYLDFIRFASNADRPQLVAENIAHARKRKPNLKVFIQMMRSSRLPPHMICASVQRVVEMGADVVYLVDTAGHFIPEEVRELAHRILSEFKIAVGFHGHNNLNLAVANSLAAIDGGATFVDGSLKGMGRAAGNASIEMLVSVLRRKGLISSIDFDLLIKAGEELIAPIMPPQRGVTALDMITADANLDLYPAGPYRELAKQLGVSFEDFIRMLAEDERIVEVGQNDVSRVAQRHNLRPVSPAAAHAGIEVFHQKCDETPSHSVTLALKSDAASMQCSEEAVRLISLRFPEVSFSFVSYQPDRIPGIESAEVLFAYSFTPSLFRKARKLKWFHSLLIGAEHYSFPAMTRSGVIVTTPRGAYSVPVAESALSLICALSRKVHRIMHFQEQGKWADREIAASEPPLKELSGSTVLIVGLGGIGTELASRCSCLGMEVMAVIPTERTAPPFVHRLFLSEDINRALSCADFVVLTCPLTESTRGLINAERLSYMKKSAFLVNVSRGPVVDEAALLEALRLKAIGGAALDVFTEEPLQACHPFYSLDNIIISPHCAGVSTKFWEHSMGFFADNLDRYLKNEPMQGVVDFKRGY